MVNSPRDMLEVRANMIASAREMNSPRKSIREISAAIGRTLPHAWDLYFGTPDLTDLFNEMRHQEVSEQLEDTLLRDVQRKIGKYAFFIIGFDSRNLPRMHLPIAPEDADRPEIIEALTHDLHLHVEHADYGSANLKDTFSQGVSGKQLEGSRGFSTLIESMLVIITPKEEKTPGSENTLYAYMLTASGYTWSSWLPSRQATDALVMTWVLANPSDRLVETREQGVLDGLPPAVKKKFPKADRTAKVSVVDLRKVVRKQIGDVAHAERTLQHRFVVRGHWRQQAFGPGRKERRATYISAFVKGPSDAPFVAREKVYRW